MVPVANAAANATSASTTNPMGEISAPTMPTMNPIAIVNGPATASTDAIAIAVCTNCGLTAISEPMTLEI